MLLIVFQQSCKATGECGGIFLRISEHISRIKSEFFTDEQKGPLLPHHLDPGLRTCHALPAGARRPGEASSLDPPAGAPHLSVARAWASQVPGRHPHVPQATVVPYLSSGLEAAGSRCEEGTRQSCLRCHVHRAPAGREGAWDCI